MPIAIPRCAARLIIRLPARYPSQWSSFQHRMIDGMRADGHQRIARVRRCPPRSCTIRRTTPSGRRRNARRDRGSPSANSFLGRPRAQPPVELIVDVSPFSSKVTQSKRRVRGRRFVKPQAIIVVATTRSSATHHNSPIRSGKPVGISSANGTLFFFQDRPCMLHDVHDSRRRRSTHAKRGLKRAAPGAGTFRRGETISSCERWSLRIRVRNSGVI